MVKYLIVWNGRNTKVTYKRDDDSSNQTIDAYWRCTSRTNSKQIHIRFLCMKAYLVSRLRADDVIRIRGPSRKQERPIRIRINPQSN